MSLLRGASLRLRADVTLATLGARAEEHSIALLELRLERLDLELQRDAVVTLRGDQRPRP